MPLDATWQINGVPAYTLGVTEITRSRKSLAADTVVLTLGGANVDAPALFAYGVSVTIGRGGTTWFLGRVTKTPATGNGASQSQTCTLEGPWWYLEHLVYRQVWNFASVSAAS